MDNNFEDLWSRLIFYTRLSNYKFKLKFCKNVPVPASPATKRAIEQKKTKCQERLRLGSFLLPHHDFLSLL